MGFGNGFRSTQGISGRTPKGAKRRVLNDYELVNAWADQDRPEARNSRGNLFFMGRTIYSYGTHWPLATITDVVAKDGRTIMIHNVDQHSHTTNAQSRSIPHRAEWFVVTSDEGHMPERDDSDEHVRRALRNILEAKVKSLKELAEDYCNTRKSFSRWTGGAHVAMSLEERYTDIVNRRRELLQLADNLGVPMPEFGLGEALVKLQHAFVKVEANKEKNAKASAARAKRASIQNIRNYLDRKSGWWYSPLGRDPEKLEAYFKLACEHRSEDEWRPLLLKVQQIMFTHEFDKASEARGHENYKPQWGWTPLADQLERQRWRNTMYDREALYPLPVVIQS